MTWPSSWTGHASYADVVAGSWNRHGGGSTPGSGSDGWESKWWQCGACSWHTPSQKGKCRHCGIKKQWGLTAAPSPTRASPAASALTSPTPLHAQAQTSEPTTTTTISAQETSAQIKSLEAALLLVPMGPLFEDSRNGMRDHVTALKASISKSKPLGLRLESCRAAVTRAAKRKEAASEAVLAAVKEEKATIDELAKFSLDLASLESELAASVGLSPPPQTGDCVTNMTCALERVVEEMRASPLVPANILYQAELQMATLLEGVKQISALALQAAQAAPPAPAVDKMAMECFSSGSRKRASSAEVRSSSADHHPTDHRRLTAKAPPTIATAIPKDLALTHQVHNKSGLHSDFDSGFRPSPKATGSG
jgi:hypothetical protein